MRRRRRRRDAPHRPTSTRFLRIRTGLSRDPQPLLPAFYRVLLSVIRFWEFFFFIGVEVYFSWVSLIYCNEMNLTGLY